MAWGHIGTSLLTLHGLSSSEPVSPPDPRGQFQVVGGTRDRGSPTELIPSGYGELEVREGTDTKKNKKLTFLQKHL